MQPRNSLIVSPDKPPSECAVCNTVFSSNMSTEERTLHISKHYEK